MQVLTYNKHSSQLFLDEFKVMTGKRDIKVLTEILDLSDVKVISHRLHTGIGMILQIEQENIPISFCSNCLIFQIIENKEIFNNINR